MTDLSNLIVVLVEPETPGNVGFVSRVLANFGLSNLRIVGADPRQDQSAQKYSVKALPILEAAGVYPDLSSALDDVENSWAATARSGRNQSVTRAVVPLLDLPDPTSKTGKVALVFGRESNGLTNEEVLQCDLAFTIPVSEDYPSLNLSHAVAIALFHLFVNFSPEQPRLPTEARAATKQEREQVYIFFDDVIDSLPIKDYRKPIAKRVFRNLLGRAYVTGREVTTLTGIVRKIQDVLKNQEN